MFHMHGFRGGPRGGRFERGPFSFEWEMSGPDGRGRHGHGDQGHGRRGRRMFDGGELRLVLLKLIADEPRHGYDVIRAIETMTGGAYAPSPGVVYPTLTLLDEMGQIEEQQSDGAKKRFAVTADGTAHLTENADQVAALIARLTGMGAERERNDRAPIRRAMRNLRTVLMNRLEEGDLSNDAAHEVAALARRGRPEDRAAAVNAPSATAAVPTGSASRYLQQLCKHWQHNLAVDFTADHGTVVFPRDARGADHPGDGLVTFDAGPDTLTVRIDATSDEQLVGLEGAVARHLDRFAFREAPLAFDWRTG